MSGPGIGRMREALRLVRSGELQAATTLLRGPIGEPVHDTPGQADPVHVDRGEDKAPAGSSEHSYAGPAGSRHYKLFVPVAWRGQPLPLVVMLHGCTQSPDDFATGTRMNALAERHDCLVAWPAQSQGANASRCWNWFNARDQQRDAGEPAILAGLVRGIVRSHAVDPRRIYVAGLSAGGAMAVILAATYPDLFAAVGVHSGLPYGAAHDMPSAFAAMKNAPQGRVPGRTVKPVRTIVFHGDADATVHPRNGERVLSEIGENAIETLEGAAPGGRTFTRSIYRDTEGKVLAEHWLVHGASHAWSGGDSRGSYTDALGPDASREMLRFFLER